MQCVIILLLTGFLTASAFAVDSGTAPITTGSLLEEMTDLGQLARWPQPAYRTIQFSSYDRRSTTAESPAWFSNADGFGKESIPAFLKVLREPRNGQPGLYLLAEVKGPAQSHVVGPPPWLASCVCMLIPKATQPTRTRPV